MDDTALLGAPRQELAEQLLSTAASLCDIIVHGWAFRRDEVDQYPDLQILSTRSDGLKLVVSSTGKFDPSHPIVVAFVACAWRVKREQSHLVALRRKYAHLYDRGYTTYERATVVSYMKRGELNFAARNYDDPNVKIVGAWYDIVGRRCPEGDQAVYYVVNSDTKWRDSAADQFALLVFGIRPRMIVHGEVFK